MTLKSLTSKIEVSHFRFDGWNFNIKHTNIFSPFSDSIQGNRNKLDVLLEDSEGSESSVSDGVNYGRPAMQRRDSVTATELDAMLGKFQ